MNNYDKTKYKIWNWKNPMMLHWIINPGVAVLEFIGITTPKVMLIDKTSNDTLAERSYVPCPHCNTLHKGMTSSQQNKLHTKNWFGYYCTNCTEIIPPLRNWLTALLFLMGSPFLKGAKQRWKDKQPQRYQNLTYDLPEKKEMKYAWLKSGFWYGVSMFIVMTGMQVFIDGEELTLKDLALSFVIWVFIGGLAFGSFMYLFMNIYLLKKKTK